MPDTTEIDDLMRQATAFRESGALAEADIHYRRILALDPRHPEAVRHHAVIATKLGRPDDALAALDVMNRADPSNPDWPFGRALVLAAAGRGPEAIAAYDRAIALRPDEFVYRQGRAGALTAAQRFNDALADQDAAVVLRPEAVEAHMARGGLLELLRRFDESLAAYDRAIEIQEDFAPAWFAKALLFLSLGRYPEGWPLYEWRWYIPGVAGQERLFAQPMWDGTSFGGKTLYIHTEQGAGDCIQFYRFVLQAKRFGRVVLGVPQRLEALFASQPDAPPVIATGQPMPQIDLHCPIMSLPWLLGTEVGTIPPTPYLRADPRRAAAWVAKLPAPNGRPRVGIVWAGNHKQDNDRYRSMPLRAMLEMIDADVTVVSLQKDVPEADRDALRSASRILDISSGLTDFAETAAVISQLDLVISVCTSVAHLAGALSKPVWILLSATADWRWLIDRQDSPWYPSARLFRQETPGDWSGVVSQVRGALRELAGPR